MPFLLDVFHDITHRLNSLPTVEVRVKRQKPVAEPTVQSEDEESFPFIPSIACKRSVKRSEWVPTSCKRVNDIHIVPSSAVDLKLLKNEFLSPHVLPTTYNLSAYEGAILHVKGLKNLEDKGDM